MAGLRQKQKIDRDRRIVEAATRLFGAAGYESVKMEDIADEAEVSVGTVYNYFNSKGDLLTAIVARAVNSMMDEGEKMIADPSEDVQVAINGLLFSYLDECLAQLSKEMWRRAMAQSIIEPESLSGRRYNELDRIMLDQVCRMVERLHVLGRLREDVVPRDVGEMIFHNMNNQFYDLARYDGMTLDSYKSTVARQNRTLIEAIKQPNGVAGSRKG